MLKISYLNLVGIEVEEVESGYEVYTETGGQGEAVVYETLEEVADRLVDIKFHYLDEFKEDGKPEEHESYKKLEEAIKEFSN